MPSVDKRNAVDINFGLMLQIIASPGVRLRQETEEDCRAKGS